MTSTTYSTRETAAALRRTLAGEFPGVKFSVRMARGTAHGWLDVTWTDGPTYDDVRRIASRFESSRFDGQDDGYHRVTGSPYSCCGASCQRSYSTQAEAWAEDQITAGHAAQYLARAEDQYPFDATYYARRWLLADTDFRTTTTSQETDR